MPQPNASRLIALAVATLLGACASDPELAQLRSDLRRTNLSAGTVDIAKQEGKVELLADQRVTCERYTPTGSHRAQVRCQTRTEKVTADEANNREMRKLQTPPPSAGARSIGQ